MAGRASCGSGGSNASLARSVARSMELSAYPRSNHRIPPQSLEGQTRAMLKKAPKPKKAQVSSIFGIGRVVSVLCVCAQDAQLNDPTIRSLAFTAARPDDPRPFPTTTPHKTNAGGGGGGQDGGGLKGPARAGAGALREQARRRRGRGRQRGYVLCACVYRYVYVCGRGPVWMVVGCWPLWLTHTWVIPHSDSMHVHSNPCLCRRRQRRRQGRELRALGRQEQGQ